MRLAVIFGSLALLGCAPNYQAPQEVVEIEAPLGVTVLGRDIVELRAFYKPDIAFAELGDAVCTVSVGDVSVIVSTPRLLSLPRYEGAPPAQANCKAQVGPRIAQSRSTIETFEVDPTKLDWRTLYPPKLDVRF